MPRHLTDAAALHREAFIEQLTRPLPSRSSTSCGGISTHARDGGVDLDERYYRAQTAFAGPRFRALYRRWLMDGERVLDAVMSAGPGRRRGASRRGCSSARCYRIRTCISSPWSARHEWGWR